MAALDFPNSPSVNDSFIGSDGRRWVWNGTAWNLALGVTGSSFSGLNTQAGTTYTFAIGDEDKLTIFTSGTAVTATVPLNSTAAFSLGAVIDFMQNGAGQITVAGAVGVTIRTVSTLKTRVLYSTASCMKIGTNEWVLVGDLAVV